jgi:hypothetical protein
MAVGLRSLRVLVSLALAGAFAALVLSEPAVAATGCRQQVIDDWSDNGRVDGVYALDCYEAAIGSLPPDIRDYTDAQETIDRALTIAVRAKSGEPQRSGTLATARPLETSASAGIPLSFLAVAGLASGTLAAGALGFVSRRGARGRRSSAR